MRKGPNILGEYLKENNPELLHAIEEYNKAKQRKREEKEKEKTQKISKENNWGYKETFILLAFVSAVLLIFTIGLCLDNQQLKGKYEEQEKIIEGFMIREKEEKSSTKQSGFGSKGGFGGAGEFGSKNGFSNSSSAEQENQPATKTVAEIMDEVRKKMAIYRMQNDPIMKKVKSGELEIMQAASIYISVANGARSIEEFLPQKSEANKILEEFIRKYHYSKK